MVLRLRKVLELELKRGCRDDAVIGGLDRLLGNLRDDKSIAVFLSRSPRTGKTYASQSAQARERWLRTVLSAPAANGTKGEKAAKVAPAGSKTTTLSSKRERTPPAELEKLDQPVTVVRGVKEALQKKLAGLGVETVGDLLYLFPNRHNDFANVQPIRDLTIGEEQTTVVEVWAAKATRLGRREGTQADVTDGTGTMRIVWFNQPYLASQFRTNDRIVLAGKVGVFNGRKTMENPEWERLQGDDLTHTGRLVPVYPLTQGLSQRVLRRAVKEAVDRFAPMIKDPLPDELRKRHKLPRLVEALQQMHYPDTIERYAEARRRVAFDELLSVQLAVQGRRLAWQDGRAPAFNLWDIVEKYRAVLPFSLTGAQERVIADVLADIQTARPMARLLEGDVGSGKTAVAAVALLVAVANGYQGAIMAPTEILAEQHFETLQNLLGRLEVAGRKLRIELLTGSLSGATKRESVDAVASGEVDIAVGTHALIQEGVRFSKLGFAVVDEQHRFGVVQRAALRERAANGHEGEAGESQTPHLLVMSATPIPRTLALTFFGDLDISVIDEMPPGRLPVKTVWVGPDERSPAYDFVRDQVREGRQAFVVCPLIEESAAVQTRAATQEFERLSQHVFPDLRLGLLHGRMLSREKDAVLEAFRRGEMDVLVATTVIEVGIDIPNASVMVIEGADRFGLAQLHQLRGRVGRGAGQSFCLLLSDDPGEIARKRLQLLEDSNDGFALAEADLRLRGPGDYFGTRQSGLPEFRAADFSDVRLIETARQEAMRLLADDPRLERPEHTLLAGVVAKTKQTVTGEVS